MSIIHCQPVVPSQRSICRDSMCCKAHITPVTTHIRITEISYFLLCSISLSRLLFSQAASLAGVPSTDHMSRHRLGGRAVSPLLCIKSINCPAPRHLIPRPRSALLYLIPPPHHFLGPMRRDSYRTSIRCLTTRPQYEHRVLPTPLLHMEECGQVEMGWRCNYRFSMAVLNLY